MITALVQIKMAQTITPEQGRKIFNGTAPKYRGVSGLIRKYYVLSQDGATAGGVYLWENQQSADALYTEEWRQFI